MLRLSIRLSLGLFLLTAGTTTCPSAGRVCHEPVIGTDLYPTFLVLTGASLPPNHALDGVSFVPLLRGQSSLDREAIFWHQPLYTFGFDQSPCSGHAQPKNNAGREAP